LYLKFYPLNPILHLPKFKRIPLLFTDDVEGHGGVGVDLFVVFGEFAALGCRKHVVTEFMTGTVFKDYLKAFEAVVPFNFAGW